MSAKPFTNKFLVCRRYLSFHLLRCMNGNRVAVLRVVLVLTEMPKYSVANRADPPAVTARLQLPSGG